MKVLRFLRGQPLVLGSVAALTIGLVLLALGHTTALALVAVCAIGVVIAVTVRDMVKDLMAGHWGLDVLAVVAMIATLLVGEYVAGLIIALMLTGGEALEDWAAQRAGHELDTLLDRAPSFAQRIDPTTSEVESVSVDEVLVGDLLVVRSSEVLPVDGTLVSERAVIDESSVTGEPLPVTYAEGGPLLSGTVNSTETFTMRAEATSEDSHYASIVRLVREAVESRAPMVRLADRYAVPFTVVSLTIAALAWYFSGDPTRFAEVLVVATPCPLLIAAPVAFMGGMSSAARLNVIVKEGGALETLARVRSAAFDKTGTLTRGRPEVVDVRSGELSAEETLRLAATAEQYSVHVFAQPIVEQTRRLGTVLAEVESAEEIATNGVLATLADGTEVRVGKPAFIEEVVQGLERVEPDAGQSAVYVSIDDRLAGVVMLSDPLRENAAATVERLRKQGVDTVAMVTGDVRPTAEAIAAQAGISRVHAETTPQTKVEIVQGLKPRPVLMAGDGINDAPVLAAADVGVAMAGRGATAASESASAVITSDDIGRVADVAHVSKRTVSIALQSIWMGIVISVGLMLVAAFGYLPAVVGALLQEVVDLVAILSALRALRLHRELEPSTARPSKAPTPLA
ncbi:heavy metal translocating P-type ATPase [Nocardiopsis alkaliphila]|uniref:heavy metal translocating P-type ATPase n=1 Tax=Nocardiopsis alkaliphila TaxID=225762 RepID=UPI000344C22E|nr:heavy metal translocating P-type ATPase [Nocardiopsis alkaliphila]